MMFSLVQFHESHVHAMEDLSDEDERWLVNDFPAITWRDRVKWQAMSGPSVTAMVDGSPVACGGIAAHFPGVGELWMVTAKNAPVAAIRLIRAIMRTVNTMAEDHDYVRVQVTIPEGGRDFSQRLVERLGFVRETKAAGMRKYARDGSTCHLYAKVY
jgi:hypothetical protein